MLKLPNNENLPWSFDDSSICLISAGRRLGLISILNGLHIVFYFEHSKSSQ